MALGAPPSVVRVSSLPSLGLVEDTLRRESGAQDRRADAAATSAGFVLAFSALVVSLGTGDV